MNLLNENSQYNLVLFSSFFYTATPFSIVNHVYKTAVK